MTTAVRDTSLLAFYDVKKCPESLGRKQEQVWNTIHNNPGVCDHEIAEILGLPINGITPRRNELLEMKLIIDCGIKKYLKTNRSVHFWRVS